MDRRSFLQTLAGGLAAAALPEAAAAAAPAPPPRFIREGPSAESQWPAVCLGMTGLRIGQRGFWIGEDLGEGWWSVKRMTPTGGTNVLYEPGMLHLGDRRPARGQMLRESDLDLEG